MISRLARFGGRGPTINSQDNCHYLLFFFSKTESIEINEKHPDFQNPNCFWLTAEKDGQQYRQVKISWKEKDKKLFEKDDFIQIEEIKCDDKDKKTSTEWQKELKTFDNDVAQAFNENKVKEWKRQGKLGKVEKWKELLESVKNDSRFLNLLNKLGIDSLKKFISDKPASKVIKVIERFKYDNLGPSDKQARNKKIRKYYNLGENTELTDNQINEYCYKVATIGEIDESSINENGQDPNNTTNPGKNILKYFGIGALILIPLSLSLIFFIKKRKEWK